MSKQIICVSAWLVVLLCMVHCQTDEGDSCILRDTGKPGTCRLLTKCTVAAEGLQKGRYPQICGFQGTQSVVCCEESRPTLSNRVTGDVSRRKCKEYSQYVWEKEAPAILLVGAEETSTKDCPFDKIKLIVGGTPAERKEFPHMAQVGFGTEKEIKWRCGGSLISEQYVLTAGHCLETRDLGTANFVRVGITNQSDTGNAQVLRVIERKAHPQYDRSAHYHDIALLKLNRKVNLNTFARPACLYTKKTLPNTKVVASGWGLIEFSGKASNQLLKVVLERFDQPSCNHTYRRLFGGVKLRNGIQDDYMVCAGSSTDFKDTCQGDSGGPLQVYHPDEPDVTCMYDIIGVTSFGQACGIAKNVPGVYTRVSNYLQWIEDQVWPNS